MGSAEDDLSIRVQDLEIRAIVVRYVQQDAASALRVREHDLGILFGIRSNRCECGSSLSASPRIAACRPETGR